MTIPFDEYLKSILPSDDLSSDRVLNQQLYDALTKALRDFKMKANEPSLSSTADKATEQQVTDASVVDFGTAANTWSEEEYLAVKQWCVDNPGMRWWNRHQPTDPLAKRWWRR